MSEKPLTRNINPEKGPTGMAAYEANGGYQAVRNTIGHESPEDVLEVIKDSNLRGRGGAGFPTGMKWSFVPKPDGSPGHRYLIANADEMEPGTFKDKILMEYDPHQLIEGMILSAFTISADVGYIFIRDEYHTSIKRLNDAIAEAKSKNYLGNRIQNSDFSFRLHVHISAGRYICGEETALLNSLEGKRATPRAKPPFPQVSGLWGRPTIVNNVETLCNITHIVAHGADWFRSLSSGNDTGTKLFGASGRVKNPGCWELPMGTTVREILEEHAGGMMDGYEPKGFLPGGASTDFLTADHLDLPMEYEAIMQAGSRMGTGTMIILDDRTCPVGMIANLEKFFARESCGFCTPCREGLPWVQQILDTIEAGKGKPGDLEILERQSRFIGAIEPLASGLKYFREDFEAHINDQKCPYASGAS